MPTEWGIDAGTKVKITGICLDPKAWFKSDGETIALFVIDGAKDTKYKKAGNAIFPESLKTEFHSIRSTIEAYSKLASIHEYENSSACGIAYMNKSAPKFFEVFSKGIMIPYKIDRWS